MLVPAHTVRAWTADKARFWEAEGDVPWGAPWEGDPLFFFNTPWACAISLTVVGGPRRLQGAGVRSDQGWQGSLCRGPGEGLH